MKRPHGRQHKRYGRQRLKQTRLKQARLKQALWAILLMVSVWLAFAISNQPVTATQTNPPSKTAAATLAVTLAQADETLLSQPSRQQGQAWQSELREGLIAYHRGQFSAAIAHWQSSLSAIGPAPEDRLTRAYLLNNLSLAYSALGQRSEAQPLLEESLGIVQGWPTQNLAYWEISARTLNTQGQMRWQQGQAQQALESWQQAEAHYQRADVLSATESNAEKPNTDALNIGANGTPEPTGIAQNSGLISTQINQALALQELGFNAEALRQLTGLSQSIEDLSPRLRLVTARELGKALRRVGDFSTAQAVLSAGLKEADVTNPTELGLSELEQPVQTWLTALELGHTLRQRSHRAIAIGKRGQAQAQASAAINYYESVAAGVSDWALAGGAQDGDSQDALPAVLKIQAQLNQLSYLIEMGQLEQARTFWPQITLTELPLGHASVEAYISYAHSLACLQAPAAVACIRQEWQPPTAQIEDQINPALVATVTTATVTIEEPSGALLGQVLSEAIRQSQELSDPLLESYALGELGHAYELAERWDEALSLTEKALMLLEDKQLPEAAYRWEWQMGRLYKQRDRTRGDTDADINGITPAMSAYQQAIRSLAAVRQNLLAIDPQVQFSFRDTVEPLYREYVSLLLSPLASTETKRAETRQVQTKQTEAADQAGASKAQRPNEQTFLAAAVNTLDALQLTELENFLGCNLSQLVNLKEGEIDPQAAKIYPILLPDQLAIILDIPGQPLTFLSTPVSQGTVEATLRDLRKNLTLPGQTPAVLASASQLYDWLIAPLEPMLAENEQIQTLVFVPEGALRNIPMGVLYDGEQYLVEKPYAIAVAPRLNLFAPRATPQQLKILRGGLGLPQTVRGQQFPSIELIQAELDQIPENLTVAPPLLDEAFTQANIEQQLANQQYSAIHWKTHGVFSSDPAETFLVAYGEGITANELSELVQSARVQQAEPLELLVLSACATAQGDRRAVLGLAGIAVRAGTRSTLSTLWRADDGANTQLMADFYQGLSDGLNKAQALQRAQRTLLSEAGYPAPYYWAPYVLVGNWL
ncbi:MAG: CHAT domain-containing protein [Cyanobacteria bacterium J06598_3]